MRILYIEDDQNLREGIASWLTDWGHEVVFAGGICWVVEEELSRKHFDGYICDGRLPDGSGYELAARFLAEGKKVVMNTSDPRPVPPGVPCVGKNEGLRLEEVARRLLKHLSD